MVRHELLIISSEYPPGPGGIGNQTYNLAHFFYRQGYVVKVYAPVRKEFYNESFDSQSRWQVKRYSPKVSGFLKLLNVMLFILRQPRQTKIILSGGNHVLLAIPIRTMMFLKTMVILHGSELGGMSFFRKIIFSVALRCASTVIVVSEFTQKLSARVTSRVVTHVIPNGVAIKSFRFDNSPKLTPGKPLRLITVGSITPRKGQLNVINALPKLVQHFPELEYHIIGINGQQKQINEAINHLGIHNLVFVHGVVEDNEKWKLIQSADIFMMLSNNMDDGDVEGFGIAVLEGNAFGLPAVGSVQTGIEQAIVDYRTGRLVRPDDTEMILEAIKDIIANYAFYSSEAVKWAKEHDWDLMGKEYLRYIEE